MAAAATLSGQPIPAPAWRTRFVIGLRRQPLLAVSGLLVFFLGIAALFPDLISNQPTAGLNMKEAFKAPSWSHLFGTDEAGRDIFSRVVHGTRYSLGMALGIVLMAAVFGTVYGAISG